MEKKKFDHNIPDTSNGDFFCGICQASTNSEDMWASHIAGKRHIRNVLKYPNGLPPREVDDFEEDSFEKPAKYRRYEVEDDWDDYFPGGYKDGYYPKKDYVPEIKCQVIDYGHKKSFPEETLLPAPKVFDAVSMGKKEEDLRNKIFVDEQLEQLKKSFEMEYKNKQANANGILHDIWIDNKRESRKKTIYDDDFEKELDELLKNSSVNTNLKDKDIFCTDKFKKRIDDLLQGKSSNAVLKNGDRKIINTVDDETDAKYMNFTKTKVFDRNILGNKKNDKGSTKFDGGSDKKKSRKKGDKDFVDIFHQMNDQKLFKIFAIDEPEDISLKKSKTEDSKLDDFDPDKLTPDLLDNLLNSCMKPKANSFKGKQSLESIAKNSAVNDVKDDNPDILVEKLEALPAKTFFQIIITRLKKLHLKDSDELNMLLNVISEAQEVVCKKLPPHLQAAIKSRFSRNNSTVVPVVQNTKLPQANFAPTILPQVPQPMPQTVLPTVSQSVTVYGSQPSSQGMAVSQQVPQIVPPPVQPLISYPTLQTKPPSLDTSNSLNCMIAWQKYLSSKGDISQTASTKSTSISSNSVHSVVEYQNYLSSLQAKARARSHLPSTSTSDMTSKDPALVKNSRFYPNSTLSAIPSISPIVSSIQTVPLANLEKPAANTVNSVQNKDSSKKFLYTMQAAATKVGSTKSAMPSTLYSSQNQSLQKDKYVPEKNVQRFSNKFQLPSNSTPVLNRSAVPNYKAHY